MTDSTGKDQPIGQAPTLASDRFAPWGLSVASAVILWLSFPPVDRGYLAWVALVPLIQVVTSTRSRRSIYLGAWLGGLVFGGLTMSWIASVSIPGMTLMALFISLWWPIFIFATRRGTLHLRWPIWLCSPLVWVALEFARTLFLSGFPWYYLAHSQHDYPVVIQVSDLAGAWGLSLIIVTVNTLLSEIAGRFPARAGVSVVRPIALFVGPILILLGLVAVYGFYRVSSSRFVDGPTVALLQTDFPQELGNGPKPDVVYATIDRLLAQAVRARPAPNLIVWPETSYPIGVVEIDAKLPEVDFTAQVKKLDPESSPPSWRDRGARSREDLSALLAAARTPMVIGTTTYAFSRSGVDRYNSAVFLQPESPASHSYHKQALVPFGEYIPFVQSMPWLLALTPYQDGYVPSLTHGAKARTVLSRGIRYAPVICFEDTLPGLVRRSVLAEPEKPADVVLNLTNDGWFRGTAEHQVHLAISVFRAVECRVPVARSVNTGVTAVIDGNGRVVKSVPQATSGVLSTLVPLDPRSSLYLLVGDALPMICLVFTIGVIVLASIQILYPAALAHRPGVG